MIERIDRKRQVLTYVAKYCFEGTLEEHKDHIPLELVPHGSQATPALLRLSRARGSAQPRGLGMRTRVRI